MFEYLEKISVKAKICPECMANDVVVDHVLADLPLKNGWSPVRYFLPKITCNECGEVSDALEARDAVHDASCVAMGLLPPKEIKRIRKELGFSNAVDFARFLGVGDSTVKRWEARISFPDKNQIKLINIAQTYGVEAFAKFSSLEGLYEGGKIKVVGLAKSKGATATNSVIQSNIVVDIEINRKRKKVFNVSMSGQSVSQVAEISQQADAMTQLMSAGR